MGGAASPTRLDSHPIDDGGAAARRAWAAPSTRWRRPAAAAPASRSRAPTGAPAPGEPARTKPSRRHAQARTGRPLLALGALFDLVQQVELVDRAGGRARRAGLAGVEGLDVVVADQARDDVPGALDNLVLGQLDAVTRLEDTNALGDVFHQKPRRCPCRPRPHVAPHYGGKIVTRGTPCQGIRTRRRRISHHGVTAPES